MVIYYLGPDGSLQHHSLCFSSDDNNRYTSFLYQVQTMLLYDLKAIHARVKKANLLLQWLWRTVEKLQELYEFVLFGISADWVFFETSY